MKVDFHLHTSDFSNCASSSPREQMKAAVEAGLDVVFITEHNKLYPYDRIKRLQKRFPQVKIYQAIEVTVKDNGYDDFIVLGVHDKKIEKKNWTYNGLYHFVNGCGGAIIMAHPYRYSDHVNPGVWKFPPHAIEVLSSNVGKVNYHKRVELASKLSKPMVTNSDSHISHNTGIYSNEFSWECYDEGEIIKALIEGNFSEMGL